VLEENSGFMRREDVIKLVTNAKNLREKAVILCMATSGMAVREIVDLRIKDIKIDSEGIGTVKVRREKSQADYITFISPEATIALKNYWEERNRDLKTKINSDNDFVFVSYCRKGKTGQLNTITICHIFQIMNDQLGFENGTKSRSHALRKYFASTLEDNGFPKPKIDFMMGHTVSDLDKAYFNRDPDKLKELYKNYLPYLTFERTIEIRSLSTEDAKRLEDLAKENEGLKEKLNSKDGETQDLKKRMEKQESELQEIKSALKAIVSAAGEK
jgi:site-specific recombinase XerD